MFTNFKVAFILNVFLVIEVKNMVIRSANFLNNRTSCDVEGSIYNTGERIPRSNACHFCICLNGNVHCSWQDCPLPPEDCSVMEFPNICNPSLYICNIPESLDVKNSNNRFMRRDSDIQPESLPEIIIKSDCSILGVPYRTGDVVGAASHNCLECRCGKQNLYCSPRCCFRPSNLHETPGTIMKSLVIGSKLPEKHPLYYLSVENSNNYK